MPQNRSIETLSLRGARHLRDGGGNQDVVRTSSVKPPNDLLWLAVADGCSGSFYASRGAQDIAQIASDILWVSPQGVPDAQELQDRLVEGLSNKRYPSPLDFCSTLVLAQVKDGIAHVHFFGDGSLVTQNADGVWQEVEVSYSRGYPRFLQYFARNAEGHAHSALNATDWLDQLPPPTQACTVVTRQWNDFGLRIISTELHTQATPVSLMLDLSKLDIVTLAVCTDGVMDPGCSLGERIRSISSNQGYADAVCAAQDEPGFSYPEDDASFALLTLIP